MDLCNNADVVDMLLVALSHQSITQGHPALLEAVDEIRRLRSTQFRWIAVGERLPGQKDGDKFGYVFTRYPDYPDKTVKHGVQIWYDAASDTRYMTHWAPIPPLPEKGQEEKDEELWNDWVGFNAGKAPPQNYRDCFLAGLKAARSQQP